MRFRYRQFRAPQPVPSLGGRTHRSQPEVTVTLIGPAGGSPERALVDSGADDTVFSDTLAPQLGVDLSNVQPFLLAGVSRVPHQVLFVQIRLRLTDGIEFREWPSWVGFTNAPLARGLLGITGCLEFFTTKLFGDLEEIEFEINSRYPGT
jgi:hypothetical protein